MKRSLKPVLTLCWMVLPATRRYSGFGSCPGILDEYPDRMHMTKIMPPYVFRYQGDTSQESGLSGIVIIAESHISIHTFPAKGYLSVDVFSCKPFDIEEATQYLVEYFHL